MFTGIVEEKGRVLEFREGEQAYRLKVGAHRVLEGLAQGDSIAVNGCCLTAVAFDAESVTFDLLKETVRLTGFAQLEKGASVNLERSLRYEGKIGGHFVTGHVDGVGTVEVAEARGKDTYVRVRPPAEFMRYLVYKGSVAIDGISLTVAEVDSDTFAVWLIPHTLEVTNLSEKRAGDCVNLEFDILAKYVEKIAAGDRGLREQMGLGK